MKLFTYLCSIVLVFAGVFIFLKSGDNKHRDKNVQNYSDLSNKLNQYKYSLKDQNEFGLFRTNYTTRKEMAIEICSQKEEIFMDAKKQALDPFFNALKNKNFNAVMKLITSQAKTSAFDSEAWTVSKDLSDLVVYNQENSQNELISENLKKYLDSFQKIDDVEFSVKKFNFKDLKNQKFSQAAFMTQVKFLGVDHSKNLRSDTHNIIVKLNDNEGQWKVSGIELVKAQSLVSKRAPAFKKRSLAESPVPVHLRREAIRRGGYALSVADINGDSFPDVYVGSSQAGHLLVNNKGNSFNLGTSSEYSFLNETLVKAAIFGHFNNKTNLDTVMTRFSIEGPKEGFGANDIAYYRSEGQAFHKQKEKIVNRLSAQYAMPAAAGDFNEDGWLDFYVGFPGKKDFSDLSGTLEPYGLAKQGFFINSSKGYFEDQSKESFKDQSELAISEELQNFYPHSSVAIDYDQDRHVDVLVVDDRNNLSPIYKNLGQGKFSQVADKIGMGNRGLGMSIASGDINNDGHVDFAFTNVRLSAADRMESCLVDEFNVKDNYFGDAGFRLFQNDGKGHFTDSTTVYGIDDPGDATAGIEMVDYNSDGLLDIVIVNGLWSGTNRDQSLDSAFVRSLASRYTSAKEEIRFSNYLPMAQSNFMNLLMKFEGDTYSGQTVPGQHPSLGGYQRNRLYRNLGKGEFVEVGHIEGMNSIADGYIVAKSDINRDGALDLVFRNADPGVEAYQYPVVEIFENQLPEAKKSVVIELSDNNGLKDAFGSYAVAEINGEKRVQHLVANLGSAQPEKLLHFGLGQSQKIDKLTVYWANGGLDEYKDLKEGRYLIEKGSRPQLRFVSKR